ncbi:MAG: response regulator [Betaproteobacteria bacterium]|nr:response regulator [Betaproteobacteria bacterium]
MNQPLRLLIVEDSPDDIELLLHSLRSQGYQVASAAVDTPLSMRAALQRQDWDLITCDHSMPNFNAPAALAIAKELRPDVPFIMVSGEIDLNLAVALVRSGRGAGYRWQANLQQSFVQTVIPGGRHRTGIDLLPGDTSRRP